MNRFEPFTEHERAMIALGVTAMFMDAVFGTLSGAPAGAEGIARELPVVEKLMNELCELAGSTPLSPELMAKAKEALELRAQVEKAKPGYG